MDVIEALQQGLPLAAVAALGIGVFQQLLGRSPAGPPPVRYTVAGVAGPTVVGGLLAAGWWCAVGAEVSVPLGPLVWVSVALMAFLLRRDGRFWTAMALLWTLFLAVGLVSVRALAHNFETSVGDWRGVRLLVAWAGPEANPTGPSFEAATWYLAIMRYALPVGTTVALSWLLVSHRVMSRLQRIGLMLLSGTLISEVVVGASLSAITFGVGLLRGLPPGIGIAAMAGAVVTLASVGPGAVSGVVVGLSDLRRSMGRINDARGLIVTARGMTAPGDNGSTAVAGTRHRVLPSVLRFLRGQFGWVQVLNLVLIAAAIGFVAVIGLFSRLGGVDQTSSAFDYQYVDTETALPARVEQAIRAPGDAVWLMSADERLRVLDLATGTITTESVPIADAAPFGSALAVVTAEETPRVLTLTEVGGFPAGLLLTPGATAHVAVLAGDTPQLFAAEAGGRIVAAGNGQGGVGAETTGSPIVDLLAAGGAVWSLHGGVADERTGLARFDVVERDPATLAERSRAVIQGSEDIYYWNEQTVYHRRLHQWLTKDATSRWIPAESGSSAPGVPSRVWAPAEFGRVALLGGDPSIRPYQFSYDQVVGVFESSVGTWVVVDDHLGLPLTPRAEPTSYAVRWPAAPGLPPG